MKTLDVGLLIESLKSLLNVKSNSQLARMMEVPVSTFNTWKHRNSMDFSTIYNFCIVHQINFHYIFTGENIETNNKVVTINQYIGKDEYEKIINRFVLDYFRIKGIDFLDIMSRQDEKIKDRSIGC